MFGESKFQVLSAVSQKFRPKSILISPPTSVDEVIRVINENGFSFPVVFKPDIGERGFMVKRIFSSTDVALYLEKMHHAFIVQELVDLPLEFGVFYRRLPSESKGAVVSVVMKEMLSVTGDGRSTLEGLIHAKDRAKIHAERLKIDHAPLWNKIIPAGDTIELVSIGNHCLGTKFINANHLITPRLSETFDLISREIEGFYFGRYDLRCNSIDDLYDGKVQIMELNGCGAEPAHIYDPDFSFLEAMGTLTTHWKTIFLIAQENRARGHRFIPLGEAVGHYKNFKNKLR